MYNQELHEAAVDLRNLLGRPGGWIQNAARDGKGGYCLIGGIHHVIETHGLSRLGLLNAVHEAIGKEATARTRWRYGHSNPMEIVFYNNDPSTSQDDIVALLDRVVNATAPEPAVPQLKLQDEIVKV